MPTIIISPEVLCCSILIKYKKHFKDRSIQNGMKSSFFCIFAAKYNNNSHSLIYDKS